MNTVSAECLSAADQRKIVLFLFPKEKAVVKFQLD